MWVNIEPDTFPVVWVGDFVEHYRESRSRMVFHVALPTNAPSNAQPYCCYLNTIIFYEQPFRVIEEGPGKGGYAEWDCIETPWNLLGYRIFEKEPGWFQLAPLVRCEGEWWELLPGQVCWRNERWEMQWRATSNTRNVEWMQRWFGMLLPEVRSEIEQTKETARLHGEIGRLQIALGEALPFLMEAQRAGAIHISNEKQRFLFDASTSLQQTNSVNVELREYQRLNRIADAVRRWKYANTDEGDGSQLTGPRNRSHRRVADRELFHALREEGM